MNNQTHSLIDNTTQNRFELYFGDALVFCNYRVESGIYYLLHVEAPVSLRGSGAAGQFMHALMQHAALHNLRVKPVCSYAVSWLARHTEYDDTIA